MNGAGIRFCGVFQVGGGMVHYALVHKVPRTPLIIFLSFLYPRAGPPAPPPYMHRAGGPIFSGNTTLLPHLSRLSPPALGM